MALEHTVLDEQPIPGYQNYLIFADESGVHGADYYGFGSLWMPWERRGDFNAMIDGLRKRHRYTDEVKWKNVSKFSEPFYRDLTTEFFKVPWLMFHSLVVRRGYVDRSKHDGDMDLARRKHFDMLISSKIAFFSKGPKKAYQLRVDPIASRYQKADEAAHKIINNQLNQRLGHPLLKSLIVRDSKLTPGIQVADFFLGAVMADWQQEATAQHKLRVKAGIAEHLGWSDLRADTPLREWKFNVWYFFDPTGKTVREARTRPVRLKFPMPKWKVRRVRSVLRS